MLARAVAAGARRLGMPGLVRAADTFLAAAAKARAEDPPTVREREVAELVAQAMSNREVARALVLSERTVERHVRSILAKTGREIGNCCHLEIRAWRRTLPHAGCHKLRQALASRACPPICPRSGLPAAERDQPFGYPAGGWRPSR
jgi:DNA-binding NarL/FixJ family response regulator